MRLTMSANPANTTAPQEMRCDQQAHAIKACPREGVSRARLPRARARCQRPQGTWPLVIEGVRRKANVKRRRVYGPATARLATRRPVGSDPRLSDCPGSFDRFLCGSPSISLVFITTCGRRMADGRFESNPIHPFASNGISISTHLPGVAEAAAAAIRSAWC